MKKNHYGGRESRKENRLCNESETFLHPRQSIRAHGCSAKSSKRNIEIIQLNTNSYRAGTDKKIIKIILP
jgi:hypothetical protein